MTNFKNANSNYTWMADSRRSAWTRSDTNLIHQAYTNLDGEERDREMKQTDMLTSCFVNVQTNTYIRARRTIYEGSLDSPIIGTHLTGLGWRPLLFFDDQCHRYVNLYCMMNERHKLVGSWVLLVGDRLTAHVWWSSTSVLQGRVWLTSSKLGCPPNCHSFPSLFVRLNASTTLFSLYSVRRA